MDTEFKSINPFTNQLIQAYLPHSLEEIDLKINACHSHYLKNRQSGFEERKKALLRLADLMRQEKESLALLMANEMGKPLAQGRAEIEKCATTCAYYAHEAKEMLGKTMVKTNARSSYYQYRPIGTILTIMPWNYPFWQVIRFFAPNCLLGNACFLKHAPQTQGCAEALERLVVQAGFPHGALLNARIPTKHIADTIAHEKIAGVTLTGSTRAGKAVGAAAGAHIKPSILELGGSNAFVVTADANVNLAAEKAIAGRFQNTGQSCIAAKRFIVHSSIHKDFLTRLKQKIEALQIGDPTNKNNNLGPMSRVQLAEELELIMNKSIQEGARLVIGGERNKALFSPTLLADVTPNMPAWEEETFGPLAIVTSYKNESELISLINQTPYGLGCSIFTKHPENYKNLMLDIEDGAIFFNDIVMSDWRLPFGGTKQSGYGRELGKQGMFAFANTQTIYQ